jgi:hypothetical protein
MYILMMILYKVNPDLRNISAVLKVLVISVPGIGRCIFMPRALIRYIIYDMLTLPNILIRHSILTTILLPCRNLIQQKHQLLFQ